jgi:uncharacterized DUF497 family protein
MPEARRPACRDRGLVLPAAIGVPRFRAFGVEERFKAIGLTDGGRGVLVVFTLRKQGDETVVRALSARYKHRKEVEQYEKEV